MVHFSNKRGKQSEENFFRVCSEYAELGLFPEWLFGFCRATPADDHEGVDAWADTDVGRIPIQIKSSVGGVARHRMRADRKHIPCVVASIDTAGYMFFAHIVSELEKERNSAVYKVILAMRT